MFRLLRSSRFSVRLPPLRRAGLLVLSATVLVGVIAVPPPAVRADELQDAKNQKRALERKIAEQRALVASLDETQAALRAQIREATGELRGVTADLASTRRRIAGLRIEVDKVTDRYEVLVAELAALDAELLTLEAQEDAKKDELRLRVDALGQRIRESYEATRSTPLEMFLAGRSFTDMLEQMSYQLDVAEQDQILAQRIVEDRATLATLRETVVATRDQTIVLRQQTEAQGRELDAKVDALGRAERALKRLERQIKRQIAAQRDRHAELARDEAKLRRAMATAKAAQRKLAARIDDLVREQARQGNIPSEYNGSLRWPMPGAVSQQFGCTGFSWEPPAAGCPGGFHSGIDIVAAYGTPIRASGAGRVVYVGWNYADGADPAWIVIIAHSGRLETWYAHLQSRYAPGVRSGSSVRAGQVIGYEGNTGRSTGAHLHWAVRLDGEFVNPRLFSLSQ